MYLVLDFDADIVATIINEKQAFSRLWPNTPHHGGTANTPTSLDTFEHPTIVITALKVPVMAQGVRQIAPGTHRVMG